MASVVKEETCDVPSPTAPSLPRTEYCPKTPHRTLPASYFTSEEIYQLERRAIFSKCWLGVCHISCLVAGEPHEDEIAGYPFTVVMDAGGAVSAYRGHGVKFSERVPIHVCVSDPGDFVLVNFDEAEQPVSFADSHRGILDVLKQFDFGGFDYQTEYAWEGAFNWKTFIDGYQECYHCQIGHPLLARDYKLDSYVVACYEGAGWARHQVDRKDQAESSSSSAGGANSGSADGAWLYIFPNLLLNIYSPSISIQRLIPVSALKTKMDISFYRRHGVSKADVESYVEYAKTVDREDFELVQAAQDNLNRGVYSRGQLHPFREAGVIFYQKEVRNRLREHLERERQAGKEMWPAGNVHW